MPFTVESLTGTGLEDGWSDSRASVPDRGPVFLGADQIRTAGAWTDLTPEAIADCIETASRIAADPDLQLLAWHTHRRLFLLDRPNPNTWPADISGLGELSGAFYLLMALSGIPSMEAFHQDHGIPEDITRLNCRDIPIWAKEYKTLGEPTDHGFEHTFTPARWGLHRRGLSWIVRSLRGEILRIGRLQFIHAPYRSEYRAYRRIADGTVRVVSEAGQSFTPEGWKANAEDENAWTSEFTENDQQVRATPVHPTGKAEFAAVTLDKQEWTSILSPGDPILEIHIPEDGPMDFDACGACLEEIARDFSRYFPDKTFKAFVCGSWLLDPQFQDGMGAGSNICRFQRECYLYPIGPGGGRSGFFRMFTSDDIASLPRDTTMRRTYLDLLDKGGLWRGGGMMLFPEDLNWGDQVYLKAHGAQASEK